MGKTDKHKVNKKAYSSVVERTAHNGFVVGSNPTKPILILFEWSLTPKITRFSKSGIILKKPNFSSFATELIQTFQNGYRLNKT